MTQIKIFNNKVVFDGHAETKHECETITLMCDNLAKSIDFKTIKYESGYAEFERIGRTNDLMFPPAMTDDVSIKLIWNSGITSVIGEALTTGGTYTWATSGSTQTVTAQFGDYENIKFTPTLENGYEIDTATVDYDDSYDHYDTITISEDKKSVTISIGDYTEFKSITITAKKKETIMSEKQINTRIKLKYDTLANWTKNDPVLLQGELAIATIPTAAPANKQLPPVMFKVGDGTSKFSELDWASGLAADVYSWAKAAARPAYKYGDTDLTGFGSAATKAESYFDKSGAASTAESNAKAYTDEKIAAIPSAAEYTLETGATDGSLVLKKDGVAVGNPAVVAGWAELLAKAEQGISDAAAAKAAADAKYTKPTGGIPKSDLATAVQTSLGKADSALQAHQTIATGSTNGTIAVAGKDVAVKGLGSAAYTASSVYATADQGTKADAALPKATYDTFIETVNAEAIADAKKAGTDATSALNTYKTSNDAAVSKNATDIANLQTAMKSGITFKGKVESLPATTDYDNGDLIIVGTKEYILYNDGTSKSWIELGDEGSHLTKTTADTYYVAKNAAITGATKAKITYDSKGLVTGGADLTASDIPSLAASKITSGTFADARIASAATWNAKQNALSSDQLAAANSGITADKVTAYDAYATNKQDKLTTAQANAVNSGITSAKVTKYDGYEATINGKQATLSTAQLAAANSGITSTKVTTYDGYASKISALEGKAGLDKVGTVTSVSAGTGLKVTGTASVSPTIEIDDAVTFIFDCGSSSVNI